VAGLLLLAEGVVAGWGAVKVIQAEGAAGDPTARMFATIFLILWIVPLIAAGVGVLAGRRRALRWGFLAGVLTLLLGVGIFRSLWHLPAVAAGIYCAWRRGKIGAS
jgi:drug/metabolite transporter (DMT)-like permease